MMNDERIFNDIKRYAGIGKLSVFVGAGVSRLSGFPSWYALVQSMADEIGCTYNKDDKGNAVFSSEELLKIPQMYYISKGNCEYLNKVQKGFENECVPNAIHDLIFSLHPNHILTTNYDTLLEDTAIKFGRNFSVLNSDMVVSKADTTHYIIKVHGDFSTHFVLKEQDYLDYESDYMLIDNLVKTVFATNLVIFIGYGLNDYNIKLILNWVKRVQSESFVMPVFIHTGEKLSNIEKDYQKGRGLRIVDCNSYTESKDFIQKYKVVLEKILEFNEEHNLVDEIEKLKYIYSRVTDIKNLKYIRREDFNSVFRGAYELNDEWKIVNKTKSHHAFFDDNGEIKTFSETRLDYFEDFFGNPEKYKSIDEVKYNYVHKFLQKANVVGIESDKSYINPQITIQSPAFWTQYVEMQKFCSEEYDDIYNNYKKAYYLAQLGEYSYSYMLYTGLLKESKKAGQWDIYYFSSINRHYLFSIIKQMIVHTTGFQGAVNFRKELKMFDDDFIKLLNNEMCGNQLEDLFRELPYRFQTLYSSFCDFSHRNCYIKKYYDLAKQQYEIDKSLQKDIINLGISQFDKLKIDMLDTTKFLYENMILFTVFNENKLYIKNVMIDWIEAYVNELLKHNRNTLGCISNLRYSFTLTDIVLITKNFKKDDIEHLERKVDLTKIPFEERSELENYLCVQIEKYENMFGKTLNGSEIFVWKMYVEEMKNLLLIAPYFVKNNACKLKAVKFIINMGDPNFSVGDRIEVIDKWVKISKTDGIALFIEKWFIMNIMPILNNEIPTIGLNQKWNDVSFIVELLVDIVILEKYNMQNITKIIIDNKDNPLFSVKYLEKLYSVISEDAKKIFDSQYEITNVFQLIRREYLCDLPKSCNETQIIKDFFDKILSDRKENKEKGIRRYSFPSEDENIGQVAAYMFQKEFSDEFIGKYVGISSEYDFLLCPKKFDNNNFKIEWIYSYSLELCRKLAQNTIQREIVINSIEAAFDCGEYSTKQLKYLFKIYRILNKTNIQGITDC